MTVYDALTVVPCAGVPITACKREEAAREVVRLAMTLPQQGVDVHLCNAYTLAVADKEPEFKAMLRRAAVNFPDGMSVVWATRWAHRHLDVPRERVYGPDLFLDVFEMGQGVRLRHHLLGSTTDVLAALQANLRQRFPRAEIVGAESPPFHALTASEYREQVARIRQSAAQIVWVGLGTPKQDWHVARLTLDLPLVFVAVGAAFDFVAGSKRQAPKWLQRNGLEWLFRLLIEPRRLWKRYLFGNVRFVAAVLRRAT
jgi:N-acetylglucosaminyldiphosphoundecaprenol N-acetyl-beta-D-mannosaminyltransferase